MQSISKIIKINATDKEWNKNKNAFYSSPMN